MAVRLSTGLRSYVADSGIKTAFDTIGRINIYTGAQPATPDTAASGVLLGTLTLAATSAGAAASGVVTFAAIASDTSADASGTAGYFRMYRTTDTAPGTAGNGTTDRRLDGNIALTTGGDINFDNITFVAGGTIAINSLTITVPAV